jgi:hypothetical protein
VTNKQISVRAITAPFYHDMVVSHQAFVVYPTVKNHCILYSSEVKAYPTTNGLIYYHAETVVQENNMQVKVGVIVTALALFVNSINNLAVTSFFTDVKASPTVGYLPICESDSKNPICANIMVYSGYEGADYDSFRATVEYSLLTFFKLALTFYLLAKAYAGGLTLSVKVKQKVPMS